MLSFEEASKQLQTKPIFLTATIENHKIVPDFLDPENNIPYFTQKTVDKYKEQLRAGHTFLTECELTVMLPNFDNIEELTDEEIEIIQNL